MALLIAVYKDMLYNIAINKLFALSKAHNTKGYQTIIRINYD